MKAFFRIAVCICLLFTQDLVHAQRIIQVHGEYTYIAPGNESLDQAKATALERAKISILADAFGTVIGATSTIAVAAENGVSDISQFSLGESSVKGEWIETIGEPEYQIQYSDIGLVIKVIVRGKARRIESAAIDLNVRILRNGTEDRYESSDFKDGDELYLSFRSPVSGYLCIYLFDGAENVWCLLPYRQQAGGIFKVKSGERYVLFCSDETMGLSSSDEVDEYVMTCSGQRELNRIYTIFSPNEFYKANDEHLDDLLPRSLKFEDFMKWLSSCRSRDSKMCVVTNDITISKK